MGPFGWCRCTGGRERNRAGSPAPPSGKRRRVGGSEPRNRSGRDLLGVLRRVPCPRERFLEVLGERGRDVDSLTRERMVQHDAVGVQELPFEAEVAGHPVHRVAADGQADRLEVNADLVRAAGLEPDLEQRALVEHLLDLEPRHRLARAVGV